MKTLRRYLARELIATTSLVLLVLLALTVFFDLVAEVDDVGQGRYRLWDAVAYVLMLLPRRVQEFLPAAVLLGSLLALGGLAGRSELVAMRAAGVSLRRIVFAVVQVGLLWALLGVALGEGLAPNLERYAETQRDLARMGGSATQTRQGLWVREGDTFINIRQSLPGGHLRDVYLYRFDAEGRLLTATHADSAVYRDGDWRLRGLRTTDLDGAEAAVRTEDTATWAALLSPDILDAVTMRPEELPLWRMPEYYRYLTENDLDTRPFELNFWRRVSEPLAIIAMLLIGAPFVFGPLRRTGAGQRIMIGALLGLGFHLLNQTLMHMGLVFGLNSFVAGLGPTLLFLAGALLALRRVH